MRYLLSPFSTLKWIYLHTARRIPLVLRVALIVICVSIAFTFTLYRMHLINDEVFDRYILPIILNISSSAIVIFIGIPFLQIIFHNIVERSKNPDMTRFWAMDYTRSINVVYGSTITGDLDGELRLSVHTASSFGILQRLINSDLRYTTSLNFIQVSTEDQKFWQSILRGNLIIIGGDRSVPLTIEILKKLQATHYQDCISDSSRRRVFGPGEYLSIFDQNGYVSSDVCLVTRVKPSESPLGAIVIISGNYGVGTLAGIDFLSDPSRLKFPPHDDNGVVQYILRIPNIREGKYYNTGDMICIKVWDRPITKGDWAKIVSSVANGAMDTQIN